MAGLVLFPGSSILAWMDREMVVICISSALMLMSSVLIALLML